eukprot:2470391-Alexandrium_andersonii.AAC.1
MVTRSVAGWSSFGLSSRRSKSAVLMSSAVNLHPSAALASFSHTSCGTRSLGYGVSTCSLAARFLRVAAT